MQQHTYKSQFTTNFEFSQAKTFETHKISADFTVVYVHGLYSDPWGRKADCIKTFCEDNSLNFFRFELIGHGVDITNYEKADFNIWKEQMLEVIDEMIAGPLILVGSSIGGWLTLVAAIERPERIKGVVGLAAAPDFTVDLENYVFSEEQKTQMQIDGKISFPTPDFTYIFTKKMFDTARENLLLTSSIPVTCPVHLLQGDEDTSLDPQKASKIFKSLQSKEVVLKLIKGSNHRLGRDVDIEETQNSLKSLMGLK